MIDTEHANANAIEISCGAIVFRTTLNNNKEVLLIRHTGSSYWSFPKGHVKPHEGYKHAAIREVQEETGIHINIECDFEDVVSYPVGINREKHVFYFLAVDRKHQITKNTDEEIASVLWVNVDEAEKKLNFSNDKNVFNHALEYVEKHKELF
ncbi:MAG: bis(5'-nucleosyl)-tetraphosphatase [Oscillospiraceae bacterium]